MGAYSAHWLAAGAMPAPEQLPRIYSVNWFRKDGDGRFVWPGYGENGRVLKWIVQRLAGQAEAVATPIGQLPAAGALDLEGLAGTERYLDPPRSVDVRTRPAAPPLTPAHFGP